MVNVRKGSNWHNVMFRCNVCNTGLTDGIAPLDSNFQIVPQIIYRCHDNRVKGRALTLPFQTIHISVFDPFLCSSGLCHCHVERFIFSRGLKQTVTSSPIVQNLCPSNIPLAMTRLPGPAKSTDAATTIFHHRCFWGICSLMSKIPLPKKLYFGFIRP